MLEVGRITRPHGLQGAVVVELVTNRRERLAPGAVLHARDTGLTVTDARPLSPAGGRERYAVQFAEVTDREGAERLRHTPLLAPAIDDPDALWVHELIGSDIVDTDGRSLGVVRAVEANPASDLLVLDTGTLIPLRFVTAATPGRVTVDVPAGLDDL
ncbi:MAG: 16S rRNA processing protein RimM [Acidimicrobiaceae bacterium]|nr:16S rRNA processing protein RimM [Acidimicrobiaceae bacterium]